MRKDKRGLTLSSEQTRTRKDTNERARSVHSNEKDRIKLRGGYVIKTADGWWILYNPVFLTKLD